jgi:DNA repair protein RadC
MGSPSQQGLFASDEQRPALQCNDVEPGSVRFNNAESDEYGDHCIQQALRVLERRLKQGPCMVCPSDVKNYLRLHLAPKDYEVFGVMWLDSQNNLIEFQEMFRGTVSQTTVIPREVLREAMRLNASNCIISHNHPSGGVTPSAADENLTRTLKGTLSLIDVRILDHIIVSKVATTSMAEMGIF